MSSMIVVDSSVLVEIILDGPLATQCKSHLKAQSVSISVISLYEIHKKIAKLVSDDMAMDAIGAFSHYKICDIDQDVALMASDLSLEHDLAMADAMVLACAKVSGAKLLTLDNDFAAMDDVVILRR